MTNMSSDTHIPRWSLPVVEFVSAMPAKGLIGFSERPCINIAHAMFVEGFGCGVQEQDPTEKPVFWGVPLARMVP
jgi:hypothetical protein